MRNIVQNKRHKTDSNYVKPKKHLGQHFLVDDSIAENIAEIIQLDDCEKLLEIGCGTGMLTKHLFKKWTTSLIALDIDAESIRFLQTQEWANQLDFKHSDFLQNCDEILTPEVKWGIIGNYPYNISTEIVFKAIEHRERVNWFGGMFQKEVAARLCAPHGNKEYGVTSVLLQAYFDCKYEFTVEETAFNPPPKVKSGVISCKIKAVQPDCTYKNLRLLVKTAFGQRRKTLHNALKPIQQLLPPLPAHQTGLRAEQLSVQDFIHLAKSMEAV